MELSRYIAVFENGGEDGWGAYVPDLPGCTAAGAILEEAVEGIQVSIELWLEHGRESGDPVPEPSTQALSMSDAV